MPTSVLRPRRLPRRPRTSSRSALLVAFVALSTDMLIYGIAVPVLPRFPAVAEGGNGATGLLFAVYAAALVAVTPLAGRWVDRAGPRAPLLAGLWGLAVATVAFAFVEPYFALIAARVVQGAAAACSWVAGLALVAAVTPLTARARNLGFVLSGVSIGVLLGPPLGGALADQFGRHGPFLVGAAIAALDGVLRLVLIGRVRTQHDDPGTMIGVLRVKGALAACALIGTGAALLALTEPVLPRYLVGLDVSATATGLIYGVAVIASAATTPLGGSLSNRLPVSSLAVMGVLGSALGLVVVALFAHVGVLTFGMALLGAGSGLILGAVTPAMSTFGARAEPPALGAAFALFNLAYAVGLFAGPAMSGPATAALTFGPAMIVMAAFALLVVLGIALWPRSRAGSGRVQQR